MLNAADPQVPTLDSVAAFQKFATEHRDLAVAELIKNSGGSLTEEQAEMAIDAVCKASPADVVEQAKRPNKRGRLALTDDESQDMKAGTLPYLVGAFITTVLVGTGPSNLANAAYTLSGQAAKDEKAIKGE